MEYDRFGAHVLMLWENSRGSRRVGEWLNLIELCALSSVFIWVHTHGRLYDPADDRDRRELLTDAVDSEYESAKTSKRTRRAAAANAAAGRPHGQVPYGYRRVYDARTGELVAQEPVPEEAANVAEVYRRLLAGHSFRAIAADWAARGIRTRSGRLWSGAHLRVVVLSPTYAGLRGHVPGRHGGVTPALAESQLYPGTWDGVVSVADWHAVQRLVRAPE